MLLIMIVIKYIRKYFVQIVSALLAFLFIYAAFSKAIEFEAFQVQLAQSPLLSAYAGFISYAVLIVEVLVAVLLLFPKTNRQGLYGSVGLMTAFTFYIYLILLFSDFIPCSCGGILEKMGWGEHLIFNIFFLLLAVVALYVHAKAKQNNIKREFKYVSWIMLTNIVIVVGLFVASEHIMKVENSFIRRFLQYPIIEEGSLKLDNSFYYFAGADNDHIYLGNRNFPQLLTTVDTGLEQTDKLKILPDNLAHPFKKIEVQVKSPFYYFYDGTVPVIYRGKLGDTKAQTISFGDAYFTQLAVLDSSKFALRTQSSQTKDLVIGSLDLYGKPKVSFFPAILEKQVDGFFDVDGKLIGGENMGNLIYTYSYRNQFIVLDKNLEVLQRLNTIDTTSIAKISTASLSDGQHKLSTPPLRVNSKSAANKNFIFIISDLMGKYESQEAWKNAKVVDIYRMDRQEYVGSFYLYNDSGKSVSDMLVTEKYLYVIIGDKLQRFYFRKPLYDKNNAGEAENLIVKE
ncbi:tellurium resistance protein TerC [Chryseobacterium sp. WG23]|uniref:MauE/DoxX family redox-associated membrane protein n=1 Tax=Chryseobacterium sp. WG23 TaxID=2926910 RepID=UPI00211DA8FE|nr:MauE/DoxX family redox-associated membrane protein [Chryseobacterium sp. WG23]MCQ9634172.1 tellurium resistance protein TerC [Chryseobacterium sp. WG23]